MSWYRELQDLELGDLFQRFRGPCPEGEEYASSYYPDIALLIREKGQPGLDYLLKSIDTSDTERLRAVLIGLTAEQLKEPELRARVNTELLDCLHDPRPLIVMEAIDGLRSQGASKATKRVLALQKHPSQYVRAAVLRFMSGVCPEAAPPVLVEALQDPDFIVREAAVDELGDLGSSESVALLRPLLRDPHPDVRQAAQTAINGLESLAGQSKGHLKPPALR